MRDLINILSEASVSNITKYPYGTSYLISTSLKGQDLIAALDPAGFNTDDPVTIVDPAEVNPADVETQIGSGKTQWVFKDENDQYFVINGTPDSYFVHNKAGGIGNVGEVAEGILGAAMFAKFTKRDGKEDIGQVTPSDVKNVLATMQRVSEDFYQSQVKDSDNKHADTITFKLALTTRAYSDLMDESKRDLLTAQFDSAAAYVNSSMAERYSKYFYINGKSDDVAIIADGKSLNTSSKVDVWVITRTPEGGVRRLRLNASLKAGPVKQFGQVSGKSSDTMIELWSRFGVDVTPWLAEFAELQDSDAADAGIEMMYRKAADTIAKELKRAGPKGEAKFVDNIAHGIDYFATLGDPNVELVQFDKGGFKILRFKNLVHKFRTLDLTATYIEDKARPEVKIHDVHDPKNVLVTIRSKVETTKKGEWYFRNYIEKGPLLEELTKVETKSWDDKAAEKQVAKIGTAHTIGGLRPKGARTPEKRGTQGLGRQRR